MAQATLLICAASVPAWSQENQVQRDLNSEFKGKTLLLRHFYENYDLEYDAHGDVVGDVKPSPWTLAYVKIAKVLVTSHGIEIMGNRKGAWYRGEKPDMQELGKQRIHVSMPISDSDSSATLRPIFKRIFLDADEDLRPMVPECWQSYFGGRDPETRSEAWRGMLEKDNDPPIVKKVDGASFSGISAPRITFNPDPNYTKVAASNHVEGTSVLRTVVNANGMTSHVAVARPLGMGLDEQAVLAVSQWKFQPAKRDGVPVRVQIAVEVSFRCCP